MPRCPLAETLAPILSLPFIFSTWSSTPSSTSPCHRRCRVHRPPRVTWRRLGGPPSSSTSVSPIGSSRRAPCRRHRALHRPRPLRPSPETPRPRQARPRAPLSIPSFSPSVRRHLLSSPSSCVRVHACCCCLCAVAAAALPSAAAPGHARRARLPSLASVRAPPPLPTAAAAPCAACCAAAAHALPLLPLLPSAVLPPRARYDRLI